MENEWSHALRLEGKQFWRDEIQNKMFRNIYAETCIRIAVECKNKEHQQKIGIYMMEYE